MRSAGRMAQRASDKHGNGAHQRALVTGASTGIGAAFAQHLARNQYDVILVARNRERLQELAGRLHKEHCVRAEVLPADLTQAAELRIVENLVAGAAKLDLLVNNAGFGTMGRFAELDVEREEEEIHLNVLALVRLARAALPGMIARQHGGIINVSSLAALQPGPYNATYAATKAFVNAFTESLHEELRGTGVRVQALCPGFTRTEFQERAGIDTSGVPAFVWMSPEAVVDASLAALSRGDLLCIPGLANRTVAALVGVAPRGLTRRVVGSLAKRFSN
jgi:uncharacterized protein